ncbi:MAG: amidohydrolase family protein [Hyphomicrobiales bacterium]|nr:amidohydrolase family protein [Hyphomicrobiales bacterium]
MAIAFAGGKPSRPIMKGLSDVAGRLAWMDKQGIDRHVVGGWPDWFGYELPAAEGEAWCRLFNDAQLAAAKAERRFVPLASVPLQDGARAGAVLRAAVAAGFPGAMISTLPRGIGSVLDAADLDPFWAAADETGAVIHIHPSYDAGDSRVNDYCLANAVGRISDAMLQWRGFSWAVTSRATAMPRFSCPWVPPGFPFSLGASNATTRSRRRSPIRRKGWRYSILTASCMTRGCCHLLWR